MMIMLAAREYGIGPAQALNGGLHIIEGKVELSARIMSALIRRAKHKLEIITSTDQVCTIKGTRNDTGEEHTVSFTIEQAQKAGLIKEKGGWKRTPEDMLYARTISRLARQLFSDVIGIGYIEGEIDGPRAFKGPSEAFPAIEDQSDNAVYEVSPLFKDLEAHFSEEDANDLSFFVEMVRVHYKWTEEHTVQQLLRDVEKTKEKFKAWKSREKK